MKKSQNRRNVMSEETKVEEKQDAEVKDEVKADETAEAGKVYYLNFKPEQAQAWEALAAKYWAVTEKARPTAPSATRTRQALRT